MSIIIGKIYILFSWIAFVVLLITKPLNPYAESGGFDHVDKIAHFLLFGVLSIMLATLIESVLNYLKVEGVERKNDMIYMIVAAFGLIAIILTEYVQLYIPGREGSFFDALFGIIGVFTFLYVFKHIPFILNFVWYTNKKDKL